MVRLYMLHPGLMSTVHLFVLLFNISLSSLCSRRRPSPLQRYGIGGQRQCCPHRSFCHNMSAVSVRMSVLVGGG